MLPLRKKTPLGFCTDSPFSVLVSHREGQGLWQGRSAQLRSFARVQKRHSEGEKGEVALARQRAQPPPFHGPIKLPVAVPRPLLKKGALPNPSPPRPELGESQESRATPDREEKLHAESGKPRGPSTQQAASHVKRRGNNSPKPESFSASPAFLMAAGPRSTPLLFWKTKPERFVAAVREEAAALRNEPRNGSPEAGDRVAQHARAFHSFTAGPASTSARAS